MTEKSKILILSSTYLPLIGGSELAIKNITDRLPDFEFDLITTRFNKNFPKYERIGNVNVHRVGLGLKLDKFLLPVLGFFKARRILGKSGVIHAYQASYAAGAGWLIKIFNKKITFLVTLQEGKELDSQDPFLQFSRRLIIKKADRATAISYYLKNYIFKINSQLRSDVIPNGVDISKFSANFSYGELTALDDKLGIKADDKVVVSASRLVPKNGIDLLIEGMAVLKNTSPDRYKLLLVGDGEQKKELEELARELNVEDRIIFAGTVANDDLPIYLKISDIFARPSRSEGLGSAFLEAMAAEVPVIGTKVGGIPDFLDDRKTGLFSSFDPKDIAFKIRILIESDSLRKDIIENARELIKEKYDWDKIAQEFRSLYNNLK
jgi:glycosyltransferase involved in cell wall biosynthesis